MWIIKLIVGLWCIVVGLSVLVLSLLISLITWKWNILDAILLFIEIIWNYIFYNRKPEL